MGVLAKPPERAAFFDLINYQLMLYVVQKCVALYNFVFKK